VDAERSAGGPHAGGEPPATRHRILASGTHRGLSRLPRTGPGPLGMSPDGDPVFPLPPTRLRVSASRGAAGPVRGTPAEANRPRKRTDHVVFNGMREGRRLPASGVRVGSDNETPLTPPTARCTAPPAPPSFQAKRPIAPRSRHPRPPGADDFSLPAGGGSDALLQEGSVPPAPPRSPPRHPRSWSPSEISDGSRRALRGAGAAASRPTRCFHGAEPAARRAKRDLDLSLHLP